MQVRYAYINFSIYNIAYGCVQALQKLQLENQKQVARNKNVEAELAQLKATVALSSASSKPTPRTEHPADQLVLGGSGAVYQKPARRFAIMNRAWLPLSVFVGSASDLNPAGVTRYKDEYHRKLGWTAEVYNEEVGFPIECHEGLRKHSGSQKYVSSSFLCWITR